MELPANKDLAAHFKELEVLTLVLGGDRQRAMTYGRTSRILEALQDSAAARAAAGTLRDVNGIGASTATLLTELVQTGTTQRREEMIAQLPSGVMDVLRVPGLGPKKVQRLLDELKIQSLADLEAAATDGRLAGLKGFGAKMAQNVLEGIAYLRETRGRALLSRAGILIGTLTAEIGLSEFVVAGDLRRGTPIARRLALLTTQTIPEEQLTGWVPHDGVWIRPAGGDPEVRLRPTTPKNLVQALFEETGPADHVAAVLARPGAESPATEEEIYTSRGLHYVPPERRHACDGTAPVPPLVTRDDLRGLCHVHTTWSDGRDTLEQMVAAAKEKGFSYVGISDHSRTAVYAGGLTIEMLRQQALAIDAFNASDKGNGVRVLHGNEVDILPDGTMDYPDDVLESLDFVVASIHSVFTQDADTMTERILKAVRHPAVSCLGHLTGRLLLRRDGYPVDVERILQAAAETGTLIELNAHPVRLDLDPEWHARAMELGVGVPIQPDAHSTQGIDVVDWGVLAARHGGLTPDHVPNCRDADGYLAAGRR